MTLTRRRGDLSIEGERIARYGGWYVQKRDNACVREEVSAVRAPAAHAREEGAAIE